MDNNENENQEMDTTLEAQSSSDDNQGGWIKLWRKIMENEIWVNKPATWLKLFMLMLMKANYADGNIKRGQVLLNYRIVHSHIPEMTYGAYRAALSWLILTAIIQRSQRTHLVLITILDYDTYQSKKKSQSTSTAISQQTHSDPIAFSQRSISKEGRRKKEEEEKDQEVPPAPPGLNILSIKESSLNENNLNENNLNGNDLNGILSHNAEDGSRPANTVIPSPPAATPGDLTNPKEFIRFFAATVKRTRSITINSKDEDLQYAQMTITSVPVAYRTSQNIQSWVTWYLSEYLSTIQSPLAEYFRITVFSASWEMFYLRRLSNKPMMTLEVDAEPDKSTELLQQPEKFIQFLRETIKEYRPAQTLPENIRAIDIITAGCIYDLLKTEMCYTVKHLKYWVTHYAADYLRYHPMKPGQHNKYMMHFRGTWEKSQRHMPNPVSPHRSDDTDANNLMARIGSIFTAGVTDESILKSLEFFGIQVTTNYLTYKLHQDNSDKRIGSILSGVYKSKDANKWNILKSVYNSTMKFSPKEFVSDKILLSNWRTKNLKQWAQVLKDENPGNHEILYRSEFAVADIFYEELLG